MPSRLRRAHQQQMPPGGDGGSPVTGGNNDHSHLHDSGANDEETGTKGKKPQHRTAQRLCMPLRRYYFRWFSALDGTTARGRRRILSKGFLLLLFVYIMVSWIRPSQRHNHQLRHDSDQSLESMPLKIKLFDFPDANEHVGGWHYPASPMIHSTNRTLKVSKQPDYNGLVFTSLENAPKFRRRIAPSDYFINEKYRKGIIRSNTKEKHSDIYFQHDEEVLSLECRRQNWQGLYFPNCNDFHEFDLGRDEDDPKTQAVNQLEYYDSFRLSHGAFRDAWVLRTSVAVNKTETSILKNLRIKREFTIENMKGIQRDAIVMERLTNSPRIVDVYGYCATSTIVEAMSSEVEEFVIPGNGMAKQKELDRLSDVHPMNNFTIKEKLDIALEMAESLADLHGYEGGVIVHDDVQLCQWLEHEDGRLKLGDFNRAEMMEYDEENQTYCKYDNGYVNGNYRAPEEMRDDWLDEKIDVFSFGNNIYGLLTGLWVFYENDDDGVVQDKVIAGKRAYIDDRYRNHSFIEGRLIELMQRCWVEDPYKRVDIFEAVRFLRKVVDENEKQVEVDNKEAS